MEKSNKPFVIGITGAFGSGKSTAASFFESKGYKRIILSSFLEDEAKKRNKLIKITRKILQDIGNELRDRYGRGILAEKATALLQKEKIQKAVIDGIRNVGEIEALRRKNNFILVAIVSDQKIRFERLKKMKRREKLTWELFAKLEHRDLGIGQKETGLQVAYCITMADVFIENNSGKEEFKEELEKFLKRVETQN